jgi:hypothetical protein
MKSKNRKNEFEYKGSLEDYQLYRTKTYMQYEQDGYSSYQNHLYKRAIYGLGAFSQEELAKLCSKKKQRINNVFLKGQRVINLYKQRLSVYYSNLIFNKLFPNSPVTQYLLNNVELDPEFKNTLTFKDLKISKDDIIAIFIEEGVLPKNFHSITTDPNMLPRLKSKSNA